MDKINGKREEERKETASSNTSLPSSSMINGSALFKLEHTHLLDLNQALSKLGTQQPTPFERQFEERAKREHHTILSHPV